MPCENDLLHSRIDPVITALSGIDAVKGALCFGSYAMGTFDELSDIDLFVLCHPDIITPERRQWAFEQIYGVTELQIGHQNPVWDNQWCPAEDTFRLNGVVIEVGWNTIDWMRTVMQKVTGQGLSSFPELRFRAHTMLGLLENSLILLDPDTILHQMKSQIYPYPPRLKYALLRESLPVLKESLADMRNHIDRGIGNTAIHFLFQRFLDALGSIVFALNERYDPATKRMEQAYAAMNKLPHDFLTRYNRILQIPLTPKGRWELVTELDKLTKEIESIIGADTDLCQSIPDHHVIPAKAGNQKQNP